MVTGLSRGILSVVLIAGTAFTLPLCGCDEQAGKPATSPKTDTQSTPKATTPKPDDKTPAQPQTKPAANPKMNEPLPTEEVTIKGKTFQLELAINADTRLKGLSFRENIAPDGGMLFVFPRPVTTSFVMRDCPVPIDIIYLDATGRVLATHKMVPDPRKAGESDADYESRLKKYPSGYDTQYVIELKGNALDTLDVKKNDKIKLDFTKLKKMAK